MNSPEFQAIYFSFILLIFVLGTFWMIKRKIGERYVIFFLLRTSYLLSFIDNLSRRFPRLWKFLADFSLLLFFSGIGAFHLSKHNKENISKVMSVFICISFILYLLSNSHILIISSVIAVILLFVFEKFKIPEINFISAFIIFSALIFHFSESIVISILEGIFGVPVLVMAPLVKNAIDISLGTSKVPGVSPIILIPIQTDQGFCFIIPGLGICIPVLEGIIAILSLMFVHEMAHGILSRVHNIRLKSTGIVTLGILPIGAFIEPDEDELKKAKTLARSRILAVGSFSNLVLGLISIFLFYSMISGSVLVIQNSGVPNLENGTIIYSIDNRTIQIDPSVSYLFPKKIYEISKRDNLSENRSLTLLTDKGVIKIYERELSNLKFRLRAKFKDPLDAMNFNILNFFASVLFWIFFFNINIALVNILPLPPFDGGKILMEFLSDISSDRELQKMIAIVIILLIGMILLMNTIPLFEDMFR